MNLSDFRKKITAPILWGNLLAMVILTVVICFCVWRFMDDYTHHGERISVPDVRGQFKASAVYELERLALDAVVADSGYNRSLPPGTILDQSPAPGSEVKSGRSVFLTINSSSSPTVLMPDIADNSSLREAEARLLGLGFKLGEVEYVSGDKDWVIGLKCHGRFVMQGDRVPAGSMITLVVGSGTEEDNADTDSIDTEEEEFVIRL